MAYADADTSTRKLSAGVAVLALEVGLAIALIKGLAYTYTRTIETRVGGIHIPAPTPTETLPPVPQPTTEAPRWVPEPMNTLAPPQPGPTSAPDPQPTMAGGETPGGTAPEPQVTPTPTPSPSPRAIKPRLAVPRGDAGRWLSTDDYPFRALREQQEGRVGYRLSIDARGRVSDCTVTSSSGHAELDRATCKLLPSRAKFDPARDDTGAATAGSYSGHVQWRLPPDE